MIGWATCVSRMPSIARFVKCAKTLGHATLQAVETCSSLDPFCSLPGYGKQSMLNKQHRNSLPMMHKNASKYGNTHERNQNKLKEENHYTQFGNYFFTHRDNFVYVVHSTASIIYIKLLIN